MRSSHVLLALALWLAPVAALGATPITRCGQTVAGIGFLQGDLDCSLASGPAVRLTERGVLQLRGFTLTASANGVECLGPCRVKGPGSISRATPSQQGGGCEGVSGVFGNKVVVTDVAFRQFGWAINALRTARVKRVTVSDGCFGVAAGTSARVVDSTILDNTGYGVRSFGKLVAIGSTVTGQPRDLWSVRAPRTRETTCFTSSDETSPPGIDFWGICTPAPSVCGNGIVDAGEECEGATCTETIGGEPLAGQCGAPGTANQCQCHVPDVCGNGVVDAGEECDGSCTALFNGEVIAAECGAPGTLHACECRDQQCGTCPGSNVCWPSDQCMIQPAGCIAGTCVPTVCESAADCGGFPCENGSCCVPFLGPPQFGAESFCRFLDMIDRPCCGAALCVGDEGSATCCLPPGEACLGVSDCCSGSCSGGLCG